MPRAVEEKRRAEVRIVVFMMADGKTTVCCGVRLPRRKGLAFMLRCVYTVPSSTFLPSYVAKAPS